MENRNGNDRTKQIEEKLKELLVEYAITDIPIENIDLDDKIQATFVNSILFIKVVVALETEFEFEFSDEDLDADKFATLRDIAKYVEVKTKK